MELKEIELIKLRISEIVNDIDPWRLIEIGAPDDEYNSQIDHIVSFVVNKKPTIDDLESKLFEIFKTSEFELEEKKIRDFAEKLLTI